MRWSARSAFDWRLDRTAEYNQHVLVSEGHCHCVFQNTLEEKCIAYPDAVFAFLLLPQQVLLGFLRIFNSDGKTERRDVVLVTHT